jgi:hypothetical protein
VLANGSIQTHGDSAELLRSADLENAILGLDAS